MQKMNESATLLRHARGDMLMHTAEITLHIETDDNDETLMSHYVVQSEFLCVNPIKGFCTSCMIQVWRSHTLELADAQFNNVFSQFSQAGIPLIILDV